ncbi:Acyl-CoA synthetase OS=Streptomyces microflavus OX=1919 GN=Smic_82230 PE=4 SV=1 [Streptomyces microflavus]
MTGVRSSTVDGVLTRSARRTPERTAVRYGDRAWTYRSLDAAVSTAAAVLTGEHALHPGDRVA